ncbi:MAG: MFS transporter [Thermomicrobiales bacterium]|nr:MFS transporter [Thermomicrobiales bacterium]
MADNRSYRVLRHRDYRLLLAGESISVAGSQVQRAAVGWQVFRLTEDPLQLGILGLCRFVPIIIFGIAGGVLADRGNRRQTLLITQSILLICSALLALLTWTGSITLLAIYAFVIVSAIVESVANPTRQALIPLLVPREELPAASTMNLIGFHVASVGGPALGGLLIAWLGVGTAYIVDACSFVAVITAVLAMRARPELPPMVTSGFAAALEGFAFLRGSPVLLGVMVTDFLATFFGVSTALMPIFAEEVLHAGPRGLGLLLSAPAVGAVISALTLGFIRIPNRVGLLVLLAVAVYGACIFGVGMSRSLWLSLLFLVGSGAADSVSMTLRHVMRTMLTPDELRGRIAAVQRTLGAGGPQLGEFKTGVLASFMGAGPAVALGGVATLLTAAAVMRVVPEIGRYKLGVKVLSAEPAAAPPRPANAD